VKILHRIREAIASFGSSRGPAASGGTTGSRIGLGQIEAVEREEFPPEEFAAEDAEERE